MADKEEDRVQFLEDRLTYDYGSLSRIHGQPDGSGRGEVLYDKIPDLPIEPISEYSQCDMDTDDEEYVRLKPIHVEKVDKTIVFYLNRVQENMRDSPEEYLVGPFLVAQKES